MTPHDWSAVIAARLPSAGLACLAAVRHRPEVRVTVGADDFAWVQWPVGSLADDTVTALRVAAGVEFYARHADGWRRFGSRLPSEVTPPADGGRPIADVLTPAAIVPTLPTGEGLDRVAIELVRDDVPRPTTALRCPLRDLRAWADSATTKQLAGLRVAFAGDDVLVLGTLPPIARAERFWGNTVRLPLGFTLRPALGPASVRNLVGAGAGDHVFWHADGVEVVPAEAFGPVSRAGVRLAAETGVTP